jgi:hypothetical protein
MKTNLFVLAATLSLAGLMVSAPLAHAKESWICYAQGKQSFGFPVGDIWTTTSGRGDSEFAAMDSALQSCQNQGMQSCMVTTCSRKR